MSNRLSTVDQTAAWNRGLYLHERAIENDADTKIDEEIELEKWCKQTGLPLRLMEHRLQNDGLDKRSFQLLLAAKHSPAARQKAEWMDELDDIFFNEHLPINCKVDLEDDELKSHMFISFIRPFLDWLNTGIADTYRIWKIKYGRVCAEESVIRRSILSAVCKNLLALAERVLVYELNLARMEGRLKGDTPEKRFEYFIAEYAEKKESISQLLSKYPLLARIMVETAMRRKNAICEGIERLFADYDSIQHSFSGDFSHLTHLNTGSGDLHRNGRSVMIFEFASGSRLVYKPRSLGVDLHFNQLLFWLNEKGATPSFQPLHTMDCTSYGWQEFAEARECETLEQVSHFYQRLGGCIAVLHMLYATDMHMENMIASGEFPQFIDLESLFQNIQPTDEDEFTALQRTSEELSQSVLRTGILPASLFKSGSFRSIELSGIGGHGGQRLPRGKYKYENIRTDKMRLVKGSGFSKGAKNRPSHNGNEISPEDYIDDIAAGFERVYLIFMRHREELLSSEGPVKAFQHDTVRSIFRHTQSYSTMLEAGLHPDYLRNGLDRVRLFDYLWRIVDTNDKFLELIPSETRDLLQGDIPYFYSKINSLSAWDSDGKEIQNFYHITVLERVLTRIKMFSREDCSKQIRYIRTSMATMLKRWDLKQYRNDFSNVKIGHQHPPEEFVKQAMMIGDRLLEAAYWGDKKEDVSWIGIGASLNDRWLFTPLDATLYDGVLGVALFYAYLAEISEDRRYAEVAEAAVKSAEDFLHRYNGLGSLSAFHGYASIAYVYSHLWALWKEEKYIRKAADAIGECEKWIEKDQMFDLIGGSAGTLLVALRLYHLTKSDKLLQVAVQCGEHLLANAAEQKAGCGWTSPVDKSRALIGLSHGTAGIAWALAELYTATKDTRFLECSKQAISYERTMFIPEEGNWADLRYREERKSLGITNPVQWCHGAAGIALGRLMTMQHWRDDKMKEELETAIQTTLREGFGGSHCQCHGDFGNLEVLLLASDVLKDEKLKKNAMQIGSAIVEEAMDKGWCCGIPQNEETPSLMLGLSGIGYGLLRLAAPEKVPPVVVLGTPLRRE
ncbi:MULTISPECIES: type 2 lanthipeptide synthetase LanM family protein [Bacillus]|uniref:type 2 lanthipeptide synthetase LanM family protein n=1 Tax=Bacillus TaxID=1386 RepID=UPI00042A74C3|nr:MULTISPECIES: type 2 lanthipeptide synthetase LanM family protein [Bacillus]QHZ48144.1 type 2 lantipeptide synthetase LanM [Bacillus sp. NSP9.1]